MILSHADNNSLGTGKHKESLVPQDIFERQQVSPMHDDKCDHAYMTSHV